MLTQNMLSAIPTAIELPSLAKHFKDDILHKEFDSNIVLEPPRFCPLPEEENPNFPVSSFSRSGYAGYTYTPPKIQAADALVSKAEVSTDMMGYFALRAEQEKFFEEKGAKTLILSK
ncbi:MAG: hypothetical protein WA130_00155 [Candidatus Methanoperedens sp.]